MNILPSEIKEKLKEIFKKELEKEVILNLVTSSHEKSKILESIFKEISETDERIKINVSTLPENLKKELEKIAIKDYFGYFSNNIAYFGLPVNHEFQTLIEDIKILGKEKLDINEETMELLKKIDKPVTIFVFGTTTCPYCSHMIIVAHKLAKLNNNITSIGICLEDFPEVASKFNILAIPRTIVFYKDNIILDIERLTTEKLLCKKILMELGKIE